MSHPAKFINSKGLAERWGVGTQAIRHIRWKKQGPPYIRMGDGPKARILYRLSDIEEFEERNTVDPAAAGR